MSIKVLVAEDDASVRRVLRRALRKSFPSIIETKNGAKVLGLVRKEMPDLILLDVNMPGMDGREVLRRLRRNADTRMIPVVILSGNGEVDQRIEGLRLGADDYMVKPFAASELAVRVDSLLRRNWRALCANPLTLLPGGPTIEEETLRRMEWGKPFAYFYMDIDRFKAYNDAYGHVRGDRVILDTAKLLSKILAGFRGSFLGHIGGDDFAALMRPEDAEHAAYQIVLAFDEKANALGKRVSSLTETAGAPPPRLSLSVAVVICENPKDIHYGKLSDLAAAQKRRLKSMRTRRVSAFHIMRTGPQPPEPRAQNTKLLL